MRDRAGGRPETPQQARARILCADGNADMRDHICQLLSPHYEIETVADGEAALARLRVHRPDLVLVDMVIPVLDGFGLLQALRADEGTHAIPVIMLSSRADEQARMQGLQAGADDYLVKPFAACDLLARVEVHLRLAQQRTEANRRKDEFLATLAHELRNPLAPISNGLQVLRRMGGHSEEAQRSHAMLERQVAHMVRLVDDLLEISRVSTGKIELRRKPVNLAAVLQTAVEACRAAMEDAGHYLSIDLPPDPLWLDADPVRLTQVVSNLLHNAAKYTEPGGHVRLATWREDACAVVSVSDNGIGIPAAMLEQVFGLFTQLDWAERPPQGGLGIGLTLVRSLVQMHGGSVHALSEGSGLGSEFVVRLPLPGCTAAAPPPPPPPGGATDKALGRILVVDDNADAADTLATVLRLLGAEVRIAHDGPGALRAQAHWQPHVLLLDIGLPGMDGLEVARRIRGTGAGAQPVLIALTGWGQREDLRRSHEAGMDHHLVKPVDIDALEQLLQDLAQARQR